MSDLPLLSGSPLPALVALATGFAVALFATPLLCGVARRVGLLDPLRAGRAERARKLQERPVAVVGGLVVLAGAMAGGGGPGLGWSLLGLSAPSVGAALLALVVAFAIGLVDDLVAGGLRPAVKFGLQCAAGVPLGVGLASANPTLGVAVPWILCAAAASAVALNALNTYDNADGAAVGLGALALAMPHPAAAGALVGFLPFNLDGARTETSHGARTAPSAYLGDSGSHLLGMLILLSPAAWPALVLPLVDLGRVALERTAAGYAPWLGDRRHLAHRLAARGMSRAATLLSLMLVAGPALVLGFAGLVADRPGLILGGAAMTLCLYAAALGFARRRGRARAPAPILRFTRGGRDDRAEREPR